MRLKNLMFRLSLLLVVAALFVSCDNDDDETPTPAVPQNIVEIASSDAQFSTLVSALERVNLVSILESDGPFTVFAPTNAAFSALGVDLATISDDDLTEILLYHVIGGANIAAADIQEGQTYASTAAETGPGNNQLSILIEKTNGAVSINGSANVTSADVTATNGVIHVVDAVLMPLDVVGHAAANSSFTSLVAALGTADGDLVSVLQADGPFTVLAPVNEAFTAIESTVQGLSTEQLAKVLTYHVVSGNVRSADLMDGMEVTTVNAPATFTVNKDEIITITDASGGVATVVLADVQATNGVIHVLNSVIIPDNL